MDIGATFTPARYAEFFPQLAQPPAFCRVFAKPGSGLPNLDGPAVTELPAGTVPWISHKDAVDLEDVTATWADLARRYPDADPIRWTYHHEAAPEAGRRAYMDYYRRLRTAAEDHPRIELVQIQTNWAMRWRTDTDWRDWIVPGVAYGMDCYPLAGFRYEPPASMFGLVRVIAADYRLPAWGIPELGADLRPGQNRAEWLAECAVFLEQHEASFLGLWGAGTYAPVDTETLDAFNTALLMRAPGAGRRKPSRTPRRDPRGGQ